MKKHKKMLHALLITIVVIVTQNLAFITKVEAITTSTIPNLSSSAFNSNNIFTLSGYKGQCTWFTYGRVLDKLGIKLNSSFYGNAIDWYGANISTKQYNYGPEPKGNSIVIWYGGKLGYGHVGFVEKVVGDLIYLNEGNWNVHGNYDGSVKIMTKKAMIDRGNEFLKGYIYVTEKYGTGGNAVITPSNSIISYGKVTLSDSNSSLIVRKGANTSFASIGSLKNGNAVSILANSSNFYRIKFGATTGYASASYIKITSLVPKTGVVKLQSKSSTLNVRVSPSLSGKVTNALSNGSKVTIVGTSSNFYKITYGKITGYVSKDFILLK